MTEKKAREIFDGLKDDFILEYEGNDHPVAFLLGGLTGRKKRCRK